jgi:hypothetical protein
MHRYTAHGPAFATDVFRRRGTLPAVDDGPRPSALFQGIFHVLLDVAHLLLNLAEVLLNVAFFFQCLVAHELARGFLDRSFRLFDAALNLVFVDAHDVLLLIHAGKRPVRHTSKIGKLQVRQQAIPLRSHSAYAPRQWVATFMLLPTKPSP